MLIRYSGCRCAVFFFLLLLLLLLPLTDHVVTGNGNQKIEMQNAGLPAVSTTTEKGSAPDVRPGRDASSRSSATGDVVTYDPGRSNSPSAGARDVIITRQDSIMLRQGNSSSSAAAAAVVVDALRRKDPVTFPVTFRSAEGHLRFNWKIYSTLSIHFQIRTYQLDGLILFAGSGVVDNDFLAVELVSGQIRYVFDTGGGARSIQSATSSALNDGNWHQIGIVRPDLGHQVLIVDEWSAYDWMSQKTKSVHFDLNDDVYVGGVPVGVAQALPRQLKSTFGFHGCIASFTLNGKMKNLWELAAVSSPEDQRLMKGECDGPSTECQRHVCENGGRCEQQWSSYKCDCDLTSFTGSSCSDESVAYSFGHSGGLVTFIFGAGEWPDTKTDQVAIGLLTTQKNAVLVRIASGSSSDFLEMEMIDGNIFVVYNMGGNDHTIGDQFQKVNDGRYHVIRFTRDGTNSSIQIDNLPIQYRNVTGVQRTTFNHQRNIFVGAKLDLNEQHSRSFQGTMAGLVVNGLRVLDLTSEGDPRVSIEGDVELEVKVLRNLASQTEQSPHLSKRPKLKPPSNAKSRANKTTEDKNAYQKVMANISKNSMNRKNASSRQLPLPLYASSSAGGDFVRESRCTAEEDDEDGNCSSSSSGDHFKIPSSRSSSASNDRTFKQQHRRLDASNPAIVSLEVPLRRTPAQARIFTDMPLERTRSSKTGSPLFVTLDTPKSSSHEIINSSSTDARTTANMGTAEPSNDRHHHGLQTVHDFVVRNLVPLIALIFGITFLISALSFGVYRYRRRDEGSYKIDNSDYTLYEACKNEENGAMYRLKNLKSNNKIHKKTIKEWYV